MKADQKKIAIILVLLVDCLIGWVIIDRLFNSKNHVSAMTLTKNDFYERSVQLINDTSVKIDLIIEQKEYKSLIVYDDMTMDELSNKLEKSMNSDLKGKGKLFASYSIKLGLDPYLALAIVLHETGCSYSCSSLVRTNNNLGGLKGSNGKYLSFGSLDDGIIGYLNILYKNYYSKGLTTPELMNSSYAASTTWANRVNWYISNIKAK